MAGRKGDVKESCRLVCGHIARRHHRDVLREQLYILV